MPYKREVEEREKKKKVLSGDLFWAYQENTSEVWEHNLGEEMTPAYLLWVPLDLRGNFSPCLTFLTELDIFSFPLCFHEWPVAQLQTFQAHYDS